MTKLSKIYELLEGKAEDLDESDFPAEAESMRAFKQELKRFNELPIDSLDSNLEELVKQDVEKIPLEVMNQASDTLIEARTLADALCEWEYLIPENSKKVETIIKTEKNYETLTAKILKLKHKTFNEHYTYLMNIKDSSDIGIVKEAREKIDQTCEMYWRLVSIPKIQEIEADSKINRTFSNYRDKKIKFQELDKEISLLYQSYNTSIFMNNPIKKLKEIAKDTRYGIFSKSDLVRLCLKEDYFEGVIRLKELGKEVEYMKNNFHEEIKKKAAVQTETSEIAGYRGTIDKIDSSNITDTEIGVLVGAIGVDPEKYDGSEENAKIFFGSLVSQYRKEAGEVKAKAEGIVASEIARIDVLYDAVKDDVDFNLDSIISQYKRVGKVQDTASKAKNVESLVNERVKAEQKRMKTEAKKSKEAVDRWNKKYNLVDNIKYKPGRQNNPSDDVVYHARDAKVWDVRDFIQADNAILKEVVEKENLRGNSLDDTAYKCMRWVQNNFKYLPDDVTSNFPEEWYFPTEALQKGAGDCEDGTNLIVSLMRNAGVPAYKVKNACGSVDAGPGAKDGGHSWPLYLRESDDEWVILDWCYLPNDKPVDERVAAKHKPEYKEIWFTFNDKHSWEKDNLETSKDYMHPERNPREESVVVSENASGTSQQSIDVAVSDIAPYYPIELHMVSIGTPDNYRYFPLANILSGEGSEKTSKEKFESFTKKISNGVVINGDNDVMYLQKVALGIRKAIDNPAPNLHKKSAEKAYTTLKSVIEQAVA